MSSLVVTGSTGQLGRELVAHALAEGWLVTGLSRTEPEPCDITDAVDVAARIEAARPEVVIHAAAWTDVDGCELDPGRAELVHVEATRNVVAAARAVGAHVVYLSTDYVYAGTSEEPYDEADPVGPMSVYGRTKLAGERELDDGATIARTAWLSGRHGTNVPRTVLRLAAEPGDLHFVDDQVGNPTFAADLAPLLLRLGADRLPGVVHTTNQGPVSWYEFAREILEVAGHDPDRVRPIATADLRPSRPAPRPARAALAPNALRRAGYELLPHHRDSLPALVAALTEGLTRRRGTDVRSSGP